MIIYLLFKVDGSFLELEQVTASDAGEYRCVAARNVVDVTVRNFTIIVASKFFNTFMMLWLLWVLGNMRL